VTNAELNRQGRRENVIGHGSTRKKTTRGTWLPEPAACRMNGSVGRQSKIDKNALF
jgi:hypothetical protein